MKRPRGPAKREWRTLVRRLGGLEWFLVADPFRGIRPPVSKPSCWYDGCDECHQFQAEVAYVKRPEIKAPAEGQQLARVEPPKLLGKLATVAELLVQPAWDDGVPKGERAVFVFVSSTLVKLLVKVENPPLKMLVSGRSWDEAWAALEAVLRGDDVPWEQDTPRDEGAKKKRK